LKRKVKEKFKKILFRLFKNQVKKSGVAGVEVAPGRAERHGRPARSVETEKTGGAAVPLCPTRSGSTELAEVFALP
jgi:hypothetical protein